MANNCLSHLFFYRVSAKEEGEEKRSIKEAHCANNIRVTKTRIETEKKGLNKVVVKIKNIREFLIKA